MKIVADDNSDETDDDIEIIEEVIVQNKSIEII